MKEEMAFGSQMSYKSEKCKAMRSEPWKNHDIFFFFLLKRIFIVERVRQKYTEHLEAELSVRILLILDISDSLIDFVSLNESVRFGI